MRLRPAELHGARQLCERRHRVHMKCRECVPAPGARCAIVPWPHAQGFIRCAVRGARCGGARSGGCSMAYRIGGRGFTFVNYLEDCVSARAKTCSAQYDVRLLGVHII